MQRFITTLSIGFLLFIIWIIYLANTGSNSVFFDFVKTLPLGDKIGHFILFGFLTFICIIASKYRSFQFVGIQIYYPAIFIFVFVVLEEISQIYISSRTFDLTDLASDVIGIVIASIIAKKTKKHTFKKVI